MAFHLETGNAASAASEVDITSYLDDVEALVRSQGPIMTKRLSEPNRKPMIRSLLGISEKSEFDSAVRNARKETEYKKLETFAREFLSPALDRHNRLDKVPDMPSIIEHALARPSSSGAVAFRKLGTGRIYQGNTYAMVKDVAPEILPQYVEATSELSDLEVLATVIQSRERTVGDDRIDAAMRCLDDFPMRDDYTDTECDQEDEEDNCPRSNGKQCERSCIEYLERRLAKDDVLIPNVYVIHKSAMSRPKYHTARNYRSTVDDGIIWTSIDRANSCSEFDALIYTKSDDQDVAQIKEIWEAKFNISPSTLWDAVTKKVSAVRDIMQDDEAYLSHEGKHMRIQSAGSSSTRSSTIEEKLTFGIFGKELLSPQNAVGQIISMATANALSSDVDTVICALKRGYVKVPSEEALDDLDVLRKQLCEAEDDFHICLSIV